MRFAIDAGRFEGFERVRLNLGHLPARGECVLRMSTDRGHRRPIGKIGKRFQSQTPVDLGIWLEPR